MVATKASLGWIGKTGPLVTEKFGPRIRLASILVSSSISETVRPINESSCGKCDIFIVNCPAQAATGKLWDITIDRDEFYSPFRYRQYCIKTSRKGIGIEESLCGICMSLCPKGEINDG
ncbi:MAG: hypothetical protein SVY15_04805 [Halobacteriota archaeon]|nr:hypothetical protein [Halobacteriota archaeon]